MAKTNIVHTTGRRKTSVARATLKKGDGTLTVNNQPVEEYISNSTLRLRAIEPLVISSNEGKFDIKVNVFGGGQNSQVDSIRQAIARALVEVTGDDDLKSMFLDYDRSLIVTDTRFKEMKKPNNSNARAKRQKSYR